MVGESNLIRAIETRYGGCLFRSRLEARWAVFFDSLGIQWRYEPEGFELPTGERYLPDFYLPQLALFYEVKPGPIYQTPESDKLSRVSEALCGGESRKMDELHALPRFVVAQGDIPDPRSVVCYGPQNPLRLASSGWQPSFDMDLYAPWWDNMYWWCVCPGCGAVDIQFEGRNARNKWCRCPKTKDRGDRGHSGDHPRILAALADARSARFEYAHREDWRPSSRS